MADSMAARLVGVLVDAMAVRLVVYSAVLLADDSADETVDQWDVLTAAKMADL
jgi:hypothetical protein